MIRVPRYQPSASARRIQRRLLMGLVIAVCAMLLAYAAFPVFRKHAYLNDLNDTDVHVRLSALNVLSRMAVEDSSLRSPLARGFIQTIEADDASRPLTTRILSWAMLNVPGFPSQSAFDLDHVSDVQFRTLATALSNAGRWTEERPVQQRARLAVLRYQSASTRTRPAILQSMVDLGPAAEVWLRECVTLALQDEDASVRLAAIQVLAVCMPDARQAHLSQMRLDTAEEVRRVAAQYEGILASHSPSASRDIGEVSASLSSTSAVLRLQALLHIASHEYDDSRHESVVPIIRTILNHALEQQHGDIAACALNALAALRDRPSLPVMLDVAAGNVDQPLLRLYAARAAARVDSYEGAQALSKLLYQDVDVVRDIAVLAIANFRDVDVQSLLYEAMNAFEAEPRGPAALGLALLGTRAIDVQGTTLSQRLHQRLDLSVGNRHAETDWKPRGYYLCSLLALGEDVQSDLDVYSINEHFSKTALILAQLHAGNVDALDGVLVRDDPGQEQHIERFHQAQIAAIIERYVPEAPHVQPFKGNPEVRAQFEYLCRWWDVYRWQLQFDEQDRVFYIKKRRS